MRRITARIPESVPELCLVRIGLQVRRLTALRAAHRFARAIDRAAAEAITAGAGLLASERFRVRWDHFGVLQFWRSFDVLEAWSHRAPHLDWWQAAVERGRTRADLGIYHETYLVGRDQAESLYLDCKPTGLAAFGVLGEPIGTMTTSRDRLGRRAEGPASGP